MNKSLLFIAPQPIFSVRGSPIRVVNVVNALLDLGYDVDLLCLPYGSEIQFNKPVTVHRTLKIPFVKDISIGPSWTKFVYNLLVFLKGLRLVFSKRYSLIHGVEEGALMANFYKRIAGTPYVFEMHSLMSDQVRNSGFLSSKLLLKVLEGWEANCMRQADSIIAVCEELAQVARGWAPNVVVKVIEDLPIQFSQLEELQSSIQPEELKKELGLNNGDQLLIYTGNFEEYQGVGLLVRSFKIFLDQAADKSQYKLVLVGGGDDSNSRVKRYKKLVQELDIFNNVVFAGQRPPCQMPSFMSMANLLISPRTAGTNTPFKVYSYLASNTPVLATNISSHTQLLTEEVCYLADPTPEAFAQAMKLALSNESDAKKIRLAKIENGHALIDFNFGLKSFRGKINSAYKHSEIHTAPNPAIIKSQA